MQYRRGAIAATGGFLALIVVQVPAVWALMAALGAGVLAEILPQTVDQYGWTKTSTALVAIVLFTAATIYFVMTNHP